MLNTWESTWTVISPIKMKLNKFFEKWLVGSKHYALRNFLPINARLLLFNALILSHLHYSAVILNGITENLLTTLEKELNWGIKACFYRNKYDSSSDLKLMYDIMPIRYFLNTKASIYFRNIKNNLIPAFLG